MKKIISLLLAAVMLFAAVTAFADTPFPELAKNMFNELVNAPEGFTAKLTDGDASCSLTVQKENGAVKKTVLETPGFTLYFDEEVVTYAEGSQNFTLPYATLVSEITASAGNFALLGETAAALGSELLTLMLVQGGITLEAEGETVIFRIDADKFFPLLDTTVADLLEKYAAQIDEIAASVFSGMAPVSAAALAEGWKALNVSGVNPGFSTLRIALATSEKSGTRTATVTAEADGKQILALETEVNDNGVALTADVAGHQYRAILSNGENRTSGTMTVLMDSTVLYTLSFTQNMINVSAMNGTASFSIVRDSEGCTVLIGSETSSTEVRVTVDPFAYTQTTTLQRGTSVSTRIRQTDSEGTALCRLDGEKVSAGTDGTETTVSAGSMVIRQSENGYVIDVETDGKTAAAAEIILTPGEVTAPDQGIVLTRDMLLQLTQLLY